MFLLRKIGPGILTAAAYLYGATLCPTSVYAAGPTGPGEPRQLPEYNIDEEYDGVIVPGPSVAEAADETNFMSLYTGYSYAEDSDYYFGGFWAALNGDWSRPGFVIEGYAAWGEYGYPNSAVPGGNVDAELTEFSGLLGYQFFLGKVALTASGGVNWQDTRLSPNDPSNPVSGSETDFVATASMNAPLSQRTDFKLSGGYSIVNETYWVKSKIGYKIGKSRGIIIGPEGAFFGNENQDTQRAGAFISLPLGRRLNVEFAGGYNFVVNDEFVEKIESGGKTLFTTGEFGGLGGLTDGGYASVTLSTWF